MSVADKERLLRRLELCRKELKRCKTGLCFWSHELHLVVDAIADDKQFNFDDFLKED